MLPQLSPSVQSEVDTGNLNLEKTSIPAFVSLYRHLATAVLDHDVSTRLKNEAYEATAVAQKLDESHRESARDTILLRALKEICHSYTDEITLTRELRQLCRIVSTYLSTILTGQVVIDEEIETLMADEVLEFRQNLPAIASALSSHLNSLESTMSAMLELVDIDSPQRHSSTSDISQSRIPTTHRATKSTTTRVYQPTKSTSTLHPSSLLLQSQIQSQTQLLQTTFPALLNTLTTTLNALLATLSTQLTTTIRHAELHTHSTLSRHLTSHAAFLATVAQGLNLKSQILALQREKETYAGEGVQEALRDRWERLRGEERGLMEREERLRRLLAEYEREDGGLEVFEALGTGYREVEREVEAVRGDVERLEREVEDGRGGGTGRVRGGRR